MDHNYITAAVASFASDMPMRSFRHLVTQGFAQPHRGPGQWGRYTAASVVVIAVAGRLSRYIPVREALAVALDTIAPLVWPSTDYHLTAPFILRATDGVTLAVVQTADGPAATLNPATPPADGVLIDVGALAATAVERLAMIERLESPSPYPSVAAGPRLAKAASGARRARTFEQGGQPAILKSLKEEMK